MVRASQLDSCVGRAGAFGAGGGGSALGASADLALGSFLGSAAGGRGRSLQHLVELGQRVGGLGLDGRLQLEAAGRQLLQLGAVGLARRLHRAQRIELGQEIVGLGIERGHALVLQDLVGLLLEARVRPAPGDLQLPHLGTQPRQVVGVELAQGGAGPVDRHGKVLPRAGGGTRRTLCQLRQDQPEEEYKPPHDIVPAPPRPHQRRHLWQNVASGQTGDRKNL